MSDFDDLPPHDIEAEEAVIGAAMVDPDQIPAIAAVIRPSQFFREKHGWVLEAIEAVYQRDGKTGVNAITIANELASRDRLETIGGQTFLHDVIRRLPTSIGAVFYAEVVRETASRRDIIRAAHQALRAAYSGEHDATEILESAVNDLMRISRDAPNAQRAQTAPEVLYEGGLGDAIMSHLENPRRLLGIPTGYKALDFLLDGLQPGNLYILAAETSVGKSLFCHNLLWKLGAAMARLIIFSSEMTRRSVGRRLIYIQAGVDPQLARARGHYLPDERADVTEAMAWFDNLGANMHFHAGSQVFASMRLEARRVKSKFGLDVLLLDHIDHVAGKGSGSKANDLEDLMGDLKGLAEDLAVPIVAVSHLSRDSSLVKRSKASRLKNSSSKEQDADVLMFLQPVEWDHVANEWVELSHEKALTERAGGGSQYVRLEVFKNREGMTGMVPLRMSWQQGGRYYEVIPKGQEQQAAG